jgi:retinitis pigmentosa 9 protein
LPPHLTCVYLKSRLQCFRCKAYGHRTGDRECPLLESGNLLIDAQRQAREDPMAR